MADALGFTTLPDVAVTSRGCRTPQHLLAGIFGSADASGRRRVPPSCQGLRIMLAPLAPLIAYRLDRPRHGTPDAPLPSLATPMSAAPAGLDALAPDLAVTPDEEANWLRVALLLDRAARARGEDREMMLRQFLDESDMHPLPAAPLPYPFVSA